MNAVVWAVILGLGYVFGLFTLAYFADEDEKRGLRSPMDNHWAYSLSLGVYCSSWAFYGSVGRAATSGPEFLATYIGPTLVFLLAPTLISRLVSFSRAGGVTNVPDLIEALYGRRRILGTLAAILLVLGVTPYIGMQLKAVAHSFNYLTGQPSGPESHIDAAFWTAVSFAFFGVLFGARKLAAAERHTGLVTAVAFGSAIKLASFLALGVYITWGVGDGLTKLMAEAANDPRTRELLTLGGTDGFATSHWLTMCVLSSTAVLFLPRQFHLLAVENIRPRHIRRASWSFPLYLLAMNIFVIPVALVGVLHNTAGSADFFLINIPIENGNLHMAFIAFIGGFSAATSMVVVSSVALATVILNYLITPTVFRRWGELKMEGPLLWGKRCAIFGVVFLGYGFYRWIGEPHTLVNTGLMSFGAVFQLAPAIFLGLMWPGIKREGALVGLASGLAIWAYTIMLPGFVRADIFSSTLLTHGPFAIAWLKPEALFGLTGMDQWSHALVWSLLFNLGGAVVVSLIVSEEQNEAPLLSPAVGWVGKEETQEFLARFVGKEKAAEALAEVGSEAPPGVLVKAAESVLAGVVGTVSARMVLQGFLALPKSKAVEIIDVFGSVSSTLAQSREELERRLRELSVLYESSRMLSNSRDVAGFLSRILQLIKDEFGFDHLGVRLLDPRGKLVIRSRIGLDDDYAEATVMLPSRDTMFGRAFLDGAPVVVGDVADVPSSSHFELLKKSVDVTALIHAPMIHERKPIGVLMAYSTRGAIHFTDEFVSLFCALANQMAMAVVNAELYLEVHAYSQAMEEKVKQRTVQLQAANERLTEIDRLKTEFLSNVSHELRTPLTAIQSFSEILLKYPVADGAKRKNFANIINQEALRLTRMINDLLDLSKIEAGRMEMDIEHVDLARAVEKAVTAATPLFEEKEVVVEVKLETGLQQVRANEDRLQQILMNLLGNAAKFSPRQSSVTVRARKRGAFVVASVTDQGPGIQRDKPREIFERYKQQRDPGEKHAFGTGLGLAISRDLVEMFGGYIWVESPPGLGATFYFTLPIANANDGGDDPA